MLLGKTVSRSLLWWLHFVVATKKTCVKFKENAALIIEPYLPLNQRHCMMQLWLKTWQTPTNFWALLTSSYYVLHWGQEMKCHTVQIIFSNRNISDSYTIVGQVLRSRWYQKKILRLIHYRWANENFKFQISMKNSSFKENFKFRWKFQISKKNLYFDEIFQISMKISNFDENFKFRWKFQISMKISNFDENFKFRWKFQISMKSKCIVGSHINTGSH